LYIAEGIVVGQNFIPSSSRPSALAAAVAQAHQMGNTQPVGMADVFFCIVGDKYVFTISITLFNKPVFQAYCG